MRFFEIESEEHLYHSMTIEKAKIVFETDVMVAHHEHDIPVLGLTKGNSFTRNPKLKWHRDITLIVDKRKLRNHNKIIPLDGEYIWWKTQGGMYSRRDRYDGGIGNFNEQLISEEFVLGNIKNVHRIITSIKLEEINRPNDYVNIYYIIRDYIKKWNSKIKLIVDPEYLRKMIEIKRIWRNEQ